MNDSEEKFKRKDPMTDLTQELPQMESRDDNQPEGTAVAADGSLITLGEPKMRTTAMQSPQSGSNQAKGVGRLKFGAVIYSDRPKGE